MRHRVGCARDDLTLRLPPTRSGVATLPAATSAEVPSAHAATAASSESQICAASASVRSGWIGSARIRSARSSDTGSRRAVVLIAIGGLAMQRARIIDRGRHAGRFQRRLHAGRVRRRRAAGWRRSPRRWCCPARAPASPPRCPAANRSTGRCVRGRRVPRETPSASTAAPPPASYPAGRSCRCAAPRSAWCPRRACAGCDTARRGRRSR